MHGPTSFQKYKDEDDGHPDLRPTMFYSGARPQTPTQSGELEMHRSGGNGIRSKSGTGSQGGKNVALSCAYLLIYVQIMQILQRVKIR